MFEIFSKSPETLHHRSRSFQKLVESGFWSDHERVERKETRRKNEASIGSPCDADVWTKSLAKMNGGEREGPKTTR
jgi:hypothetical protein